MKRFAVILVIIGLSLIPSVTLAESQAVHESTPTAQPPVDTETIANQIPDIAGTTETPIDIPVSAPKPSSKVQVVSTPECTCNHEAEIQDLYDRDGWRFEQMNENYEILVDRIEDLQGQIYELQNTTSY